MNISIMTFSLKNLKFFWEEEGAFLTGFVGCAITHTVAGL
jgi:hypothetical protein